jgi:hypothetical protein
VQGREKTRSNLRRSCEILWLLLFIPFEFLEASKRFLFPHHDPFLGSQQDQETMRKKLVDFTVGACGMNSPRSSHQLPTEPEFFLSIMY